jgi:4-carboxymuconolactone decarboxylase
VSNHRTSSGAKGVPRIPPLSPPYTQEIEAMLNSWMRAIPGREPLRIFRTFAVHRDLAPRTGVLGAGILAHGRVAEREREVMIHRTCALCGAEYEWGVHAALAAETLGFSDEQLYSTVHGTSSDGCWTEREALVFDLADELHQTSTVSADLFEALSERWEDDQILELLITAGWYRAIAYVVNGTQVMPEEWGRRFPRRQST